MGCWTELLAILELFAGAEDNNNDMMHFTWVGIVCYLYLGIITRVLGTGTGGRGPGR